MNIHTMSKAVGASITTLGLIAMTSGPALAANVSVGGSNLITGANSSNQNTYTVSDDSSLMLDNLASSLNSLNLNLSNGHNLLANNTTVGGFSTGNLNATGTFNTNLNTTPVLVAGSTLTPSSVTGLFNNNTTGFSSINDNTLNVNNNRTTHINNSADINNTIGINATTGFNSILNNTTVGPVSLGGANIGLSVNNTANQGAASSLLLPSAPSSVTVTGGNGTTGANSQNLNDVNVNNMSDTSVNNTSTINNQATLTANSGGNFIGANTTVGPVQTGGVTANLSFTNSAN